MIHVDAKAFRLLVVEDDEQTAEYMHRYLPCFDVFTTGTLQGAVKLLHEAHGFHVVLLDLHLPDCTGEETVSRVAAVCPDTPIVVITGCLDASDDDLLRAGAEEVLHKPLLEPWNLREIIKRAMTKHRSRAEMEHVNDALARAEDTVLRIRDCLCSRRPGTT